MKVQLAGWLLGAALLGAAWTAPEPENPFVLAGKAARVGPAGSLNYLLPLLELRRQRPAYLPGAAGGPYWQALATYAAMAGELDSAAYYWQQQPGYAAPAPAPAPVVAPVAAEAAILAQTRQRQVVMFNEEHTQPRGRWLVGRLLPALYQQGFRYLALEALDAADSASLRQRGYPVAASGFYTNEPHFGNLMRRARQLGFHLVAYDAMSDDRERDEARNLLAATLGSYPQARVVVLAGHGHINESSTAPTMATWVRKLSGIDPLTIEQTQAAAARPARWPQLPAGAYLVPPTALVNRALTCDLYVVNKLAVSMLGNGFGDPAARLTRVVLPADSLRPPQVLLVYWQREKQAEPGAVPVAVHCLRPGQAEVRLPLLPGTYVAELRDAPGRQGWQKTFSVR